MTLKILCIFTLLCYKPDTLELFYNFPNGTSITIPLVKKGIAWWTDKHVKFRNPGGNNNNLTAAFSGNLFCSIKHDVNIRVPIKTE